jgi:ubiquitin carboxyl-terminal hydrolase 5/13
VRFDTSQVCRPRVPFAECLRTFIKDEHISDFYSSETKQRGSALKSQLFRTFPDYLCIQMKKFELAADWTPVKLDVEIDVPDRLNLNEFRSSGLKPNEVELKDDDIGGNQASNQIVLNESLVSQLVDMGFSLEGSKKAVYNTRDANDAEAAVNWAVIHMEDSNFNAPFEIPNAKKTSQPINVDDEAVNQLMSYGFNRTMAVKALTTTNNNIERAADWLFNMSDELLVSASEEPTTTVVSNDSSNDLIRDGSGNYELMAFVSHMGSYSRLFIGSRFSGDCLSN